MSIFDNECSGRKGIAGYLFFNLKNNFSILNDYHYFEEEYKAKIKTKTLKQIKQVRGIKQRGNNNQGYRTKKEEKMKNEK